MSGEVTHSAVPLQTDLVGQNPTTGVVDYLKYIGTTLAASFAVDYGLGSAWKIVANGNFNADAFPDLVAQNAAGQLDFLYLNASGKLIGTFMTANTYPAVHGEGFFGTAVNQRGPSLVSQLPNGSIDILAFGPVGAVTEQLVASDLIPGTVGFPTLIGASSQNNNNNPAFNQLNDGDNSALFTQLPNGTFDIIGLTGSILGATLKVATTNLMPSTLGSAPGF